MSSRTAGRLIAAPLMFIGFRWATQYMLHAPPGVHAVVDGLGAVMLGLVGVLLAAGFFVRLFPRLGAGRRARRSP